MSSVPLSLYIKTMQTLLLLCLTATILCADTRLEDSASDDLRMVTIRVSEGSFTLEHLEELARLELSRTPHVNLIRLTIMGAQGWYSVPTPDHFGFQTWINVYSSSNEPNEVAEMVAIRDNAVLRVRDRSGMITEKILSGKNPLRIAVAGQDFQVLYVYASLWRQEDIRFFIRTASPLRVDSGEELLRMFQVALPNRAIAVNVQNDGLFIGSPGYPFLNPFVRIEKPPTEQEYIRMKTLRCDSTRMPMCEIR
jgi:hypothetical protein